MENKLVYQALDYNDQKENIIFAEELYEKVNSDKFGFKINLDSLISFSPSALKPYDLINYFLIFKKQIFLDLKMWNGGRTMENIAKGSADLGVAIINMYPHAGGKFMKRVKKSLDSSNTKLFGLTVLTHYTDEDTLELYGKNLTEAVRMLAQMNYDSGADGVIVPGNQLDTVKDIPLLKLCPGIRPEWFIDKKANNQEQTVTHQQAFSSG